MEDRPEPVELTQDFTLYCETHGVFQLYQRLIQGLIISMPDDPLKFITENIHAQTVLRVSIQGPPCSGKKTQASALCESLGLGHISVEDLRNDSSNPDEPIEAHAFVDMVKSRTAHDDCSKGFVLEGLPQNKRQAQELAKAGVLLDRVIFLDVSDPTILVERNKGRVRCNGKNYHVEFNPPPAGSEPVPATYENLDNTINDSRKRIRLLAEFYSGVAVNIDTDQIIDDIHSQIELVVAKKAPSSAPHPVRFVMRGPPGTQVEQICEQLTDRVGVVSISVDTLIKREIACGTLLGKQISAAKDNGKELPIDAFVKLVSNRLKQKDCINQGWVLSGLPNRAAPAEALETTPYRPNRYIQLDVPMIRALECSEGWVVDTRNNQRYHPTLNKAPPGIDMHLVKDPNADPELCKAKVDEYFQGTESYQKLYGKRLTSVNADQSIPEILDSLVHACRS